jgi:hypothetical protein
MKKTEKSGKPPRFRWRTHASWDPGFWGSIGWPYFHDDEYGRKTIVVGTILTGYLQVAYRKCQCEDCVDNALFAKLEEQYGVEFADEVLERRIYLRSVPDRQPRV